MNVLVAVDDSVYSDACTRAVAARPWPADTKLRVLSVTGVLPAAPLPEPAAEEAPRLRSLMPRVGEQERHVHLLEAARRTAERGVNTLAAHGVASAQLRVRDGLPGSEIVEEALEWPADLIVVGTRGRSAIKRILLGSVANYIVRHAPCSVEIVRERERL